MKNKVHVKTGDTVVLSVGKFNEKYKDDKKTPKTGKVLEVSPKEQKVIVEGINMVKKHIKPTQMGQQGGIVETEAYIAVSNVMYLHKGQPTRIGFKMDGDKKVRFAKKTGDVID